MQRQRKRPARRYLPELPGDRQDRPRHRRRLIGRVLLSGAFAAAASAAAAALCSRVENRHAERPLNAIAHIYDGGAPPARDGRNRRNTFVGLGLHTGASLWWAAFFEGLFGRRARRGTRQALLGGATVAAMAYVVDYHIVGRRFRPGFEAHLSRRSLLAIYAALAAGFAAAARSSRLHHHEIEDGDERGERRPAEPRPGGAVAPEQRRQRLAALGGEPRHVGHSNLQPDHR